jgi:predicted Zn-dependent protease
LPLFSDTVARIIPQYIENKYGEGIKNTYLRTESIDTSASHTLQLFFENLNFTKDINPQLYVVKSDVVNAFTFPGNTIIVFDEMIRRTETKEQLGALLAHEYSHMTQRHALRSMAASMSSGILLSIVVGDASGALGGLAQNVDQLRLLKYSRNFETEADTYGMQLLKQSKIDPSGMTGLFKILKKEEKNIIGNSNILDKLEFLSTHPLTEERIKNAEEVELKKDYIVKENPTLQSLYNQLKLQTISVVF